MTNWRYTEDVDTAPAPKTNKQAQEQTMDHNCLTLTGPPDTALQCHQHAPLITEYIASQAYHAPSQAYIVDCSVH